MSLAQDITDALVVADNLPALVKDVEAIVTEFKSQEDGAAKIAALASGIAQLAATVAAVAAAMETAK